LSQYTRVTDGRTDRRTDRILITIPRLHYMQRGKNAIQRGQWPLSVAQKKMLEAEHHTF